MDEFDKFFLKYCRFYKYLLPEIAHFKKYLKCRKVCKIEKGHLKMSKILSPGTLPDPWIETMSPTWASRFFTTKSITNVNAIFSHFLLLLLLSHFSRV